MVFISGVWAQRGASRQCEIGTNLLQEGGKKSPRSLSKHRLRTISQTCLHQTLLCALSNRRKVYFTKERGRKKALKTSCDPDNSVISNPMQTHGINCSLTSVILHMKQPRLQDKNEACSNLDFGEIRL